MKKDVIVRFATNQDLPTLQQLDEWPKEKIWRQKILANEVILIEENDKVVGLLRFSILWTTVPFIGLINILSEYRGKGYSVNMLDFLKSYLKDEGYVALLSSSQTNEPEPQNWHVHMGFHTNGIIENIDDDNIGEIVYRMLL